MDILEQVAEQIHEGWREYQVRLGRVRGPARTERTHPHLVAWSELDTASQNQDRFIAAVILNDWSRGLLIGEDLPRAIHEAWRRWVALHAEAHSHAIPFDLAHPAGCDEHDRQARRIEPLLPVRGGRPIGGPGDLV